MASEPGAVDVEEAEDFILILVANGVVTIDTTMERQDAIDELLEAVDMLEGGIELVELPEARLI